ncbi:ketopantoate reductase [Nocardia brasiliensis NBRC 14402]|uniref:2-dehydropantoate 2-reductase n=1 Tax=Nocardia brasiliensis TaxID=37326 RepID=UPI0002E997FC|nr:2-dehydropantoate 2-reductase [Nocardia brasiliensis]AVL26260.1 2-dehydropantoate 2-reductase [Nocardia brasiliensis]GAJ84101.1 ketopantoate reductase [Nocardia brasiliensis NBRC 14402]SUB48085.1 2-dehydropantoate 2-reductase [Nocardia brasiliensis]
MTSRVMVIGAGSIGIFVGGKLAVAGADVTFVGRPRLLDEIAASGIRLTDLDGGDDALAADRFRVATEPDDIGSAELVLVTVKSAATADAVRELAGKIRPGTVVLSLQNGIGNDTVIREILPHCVVLAGMVMFNVVHHAAGRFHRGTEGGLAVQDDPELAPFLGVFEQAGLALRRYPDLRPVQWAKLLLNLNNPINALSGRPLREQLADRDYRRCLALTQREALTVMNKARIAPARLTPVPPRVMATLLTVPDGIFRRVFGQVLAVDPMARSSMSDDLALRRKTEISWLCGEIVGLGAMVDLPTPVNQRLIELVVAAEQGDRRTWTGPELLAQLRAARAAIR